MRLVLVFSRTKDVGMGHDKDFGGESVDCFDGLAVVFNQDHPLSNFGSREFLSWDDILDGDCAGLSGFESRGGNSFALNRFYSNFAELSLGVRSQSPYSSRIQAQITLSPKNSTDDDFILDGNPVILIL